MKYVNYLITFSEVPDEICLSISISGCPNKCEECHSPHLNKDIGTILNRDSLCTLLNKNTGITCVCFLGGDAEPKEINSLAQFIKENYHYKVCWYSGNDSISKFIDIHNFDYIKTGHYDKDKGPLTSKQTNQRMYQIIITYGDNGREFQLTDITYKFWKHEN